MPNMKRSLGRNPRPRTPSKMSAPEAHLAPVTIRQAIRRSSAGLLWWSCAAVCGSIVLTAIAGCQQQSTGRPPSAIVELTGANFQSEVIESKQPVLVEFWAPWCRPCVEMMPALEQVARESSGRAKVGKLRIDENEEFASKFGVDAPPAVIVFRGGRVFKRRSGKQTADALRKLVAASLSDDRPEANGEP